MRYYLMAIRVLLAYYTLRLLRVQCVDGECIVPECDLIGYSGGMRLRDVMPEIRRLRELSIVRPL